MRITLIAVGRLRPALREVGDDYFTRLSRWAELREVQLREAARAGSPSVQRRREGEAIVAAIPPGAFTVLLDVAGRAWGSTELAGAVGRWREAGRPVALIIGGAEGVDPAVADRADIRWSLGPLTLPHELVRVVVLEQLYRSFSILEGLPYHRAGRPDR